MMVSRFRKTVGFIVVACLCAAPALAQERRVLVVGSIGGASLGNADSEMGNALIVGGGAGFHLTPRLIVEADVHRGSVRNVFGRAHHDFTETTFTGSVIFRSAPEGRVHFIGGGGIGLQRAHNDVDDPPFRIVRTDTIRLLHGRAGAEWDISNRLSIRTEAVMWFGEGLDWVFGGRGGVVYRF